LAGVPPARGADELVLGVDPDRARSVVAGALAPGGDGLARVRDRDLAVVAVDLRKAGGRLVRGAGPQVGDVHGRGPRRAAVGRGPVPDIPGVVIAAARGLVIERP